MDINEAVAQLRAAFPRVKWVLRPTCISAYRDDGGLLLLVAPQDEGWIANCETGWVGAQVPDPVSAVRAWLAAQPTAAFYPEPSSGEVVEVKGWVAFNDANDYAFAPDGGAGNEWESRQDAIDGLLHHGDPIVHAFTLRVPLPVDPPVLVGEVFDV